MKNLLSDKITVALSASILILSGSTGYAIAQSPRSDTSPLGIRTENEKQDIGSLISAENVENSVSDNSSLFTPSTFTARFGQNAFSRFVQASQREEEVNASDIMEISNKVASDLAANSNIKFTEYSLVDLSIISAPTTSDWQKFISDINTIRSKYASIFRSSTNLGGLATLGPNNIPSILKAGDLYSQMAEELLTTPVPAPALQSFLKLVNAYSKAAAGLPAFKYLSDDPVRVIPGLSLYSESQDDESAALSEIQVLLISNGIIFSGTYLAP